MRDAEFLMVRILYPGRKANHTDPRVGLAQVCGSGVETFLRAGIGTRGGIRVLHNRIGRYVEIGCSEGTKRVQVPQELNGLQLTSKLQLEHIPHSEIISGGKGNCLESDIVQIRINRGKPPKCKSHCWSGTARQLVRIAAANHGRRQAIAIANITAEGEVSIRENRTLKGKGRAHVGTGAVSSGS